jgi:hypothetical protein
MKRNRSVIMRADCPGEVHHTLRQIDAFVTPRVRRTRTIAYQTANNNVHAVARLIVNPAHDRTDINALCEDLQRRCRMGLAEGRYSYSPKGIRTPFTPDKINVTFEPAIYYTNRDYAGVEINFSSPLTQEVRNAMYDVITRNGYRIESSEEVCTGVDTQVRVNLISTYPSKDTDGNNSMLCMTRIEGELNALPNVSASLVCDDDHADKNNDDDRDMASLRLDQDAETHLATLF